MAISKKRKAILEKYDLQKRHALSEAAEIVKSITTTKFDSSIDVDIRLGVDPRKMHY